jgi:hypothetical protein
MGDAPRSPVDLTAAREVLRVKPVSAKPGRAASAAAKPAGAKPAAT